MYDFSAHQKEPEQKRKPEAKGCFSRYSILLYIVVIILGVFWIFNYIGNSIETYYFRNYLKNTVWEGESYDEYGTIYAELEFGDHKIEHRTGRNYGLSNRVSGVYYYEVVDPDIIKVFNSDTTHILDIRDDIMHIYPEFIEYEPPYMWIKKRVR